MMPSRRPGGLLDGLDPGHTHVFVPGMMGAGVLLSLGLLLSDAVQRLRGDAGARREVQLGAWFITRDVVRSVHRDADLDPAVGLRSRRTYAVLAVLVLALGVYGLIGSTWNYLNPVDEGWVEDVAWVYALSLLAVAAILCLGSLLLRIAWTYPQVPPWARRFLARTPLGVAPGALMQPGSPPLREGGRADGRTRTGPGPTGNPPGTRRRAAGPPR